MSTRPMNNNTLLHDLRDSMSILSVISLDTFCEHIDRLQKAGFSEEDAAKLHITTILFYGYVGIADSNLSLDDVSIIYNSLGKVFDELLKDRPTYSTKDADHG